MTNNEISLVRELMLKSISEDEFNKCFTVDVLHNPKYVKQLLENAYEEKNSDDVEYALFIGFSFDVFTDEFVEILCKLIECDWQFQHENIAIILQKLKLPQSIESVYKTVLTQFDYLEYDESYALAVKCVWALGDINTDDSRKKLELLKQSEKQIIRENVLRQLNR